MTTVFPVCVPGNGPVPCDRMIVGGAPGRKEIEEGAPFVGNSEKILDKWLACFEWSREHIYITNAFKGDVGPTNRDPTDQELADHHPILMDEIQRVRPIIIMTLGRIPTKALLPEQFPKSRSRLGPVVGRLRHSPVAKVPVIPGYHPAAPLDRAMRADSESAMHCFLAYSGLTQGGSVSAVEQTSVRRVGGMVVRGLFYVLLALATFVVVTFVTSRG
jgi:uracil-DNA glycosylase family 4